MWEKINTILGTFKSKLNYILKIFELGLFRGSLDLIALLFPVVNTIILAQWDAVGSYDCDP